MLHKLLSTDDVPERARFSYWREMTKEVFLDLSPERTSRDEPFVGSITAGAVGAVPFAFVRSGAQRVHRTKADIARSPQSRFFVNFQLEGESSFSQGRAEDVRLARGDLALVDAARPFSLGFDERFCHFNVELPEHVVRSRFGDADGVGGTVVRCTQGVGSLASSYLRSLADAAEGEGLPPGIGANLVDLLTLAFGAPSDSVENAVPSLEDARLQVVDRYIEAHLDDAALGPAMIAADLEISMRYLHKLFEPRGETLMQRVLRRRLERCRADLADPSMRRKGIAEIAFARGFSDLSHFGRAFRAAFGETPRAWRAVAEPGRR